MFYTWYLNFLGQEKIFFIFQNKVVKRGLVESGFFYISLWKSLEVAGFAHMYLTYGSFPQPINCDHQLVTPTSNNQSSIRFIFYI